MGNDLIKSLELMFLGMIGIFVVLILIYLVIVLLNKFTNKKVDTSEESKADSKENEKAESVSTVDNSEEELVCAIVEAVICEELHTEPDKLKIIEINEK